MQIEEDETVMQTEEEGEYQFDDSEDLIQNVDWTGEDCGIVKKAWFWIKKTKFSCYNLK